MQRDALSPCCLGSSLAGVALIDVGELNLLAGRVLDLRAQAAYRGSIADIGRCDVKGKQVAERVDGQVHLRAELTFGAVIAGAGASAAQRYVEVVADAGINDKVSPNVWDEVVRVLVSAAKDGRPGDGFVAAIERCGTVLAEHFPPGAVNRDELADRLLEI